MSNEREGNGVINYPRGADYGGVMAGRPPSVQYSPSYEQRQIDQNRTNYSSRMGIICEKAITPLWANPSSYKQVVRNISFEESLKNIHRELSPIKHRTYKHLELLKFYESYALPVAKSTGFDLARKPGQPDFRNLVESVDEIYDISMMKEYDSVMGNYQVIPEKFRYFFEAVMLLAKEPLHPTDVEPKGWTLYPDITLTDEEGKMFRQLDGVLVLDKNKPADGQIDLWKVLDSGEPWMELEMKSVFEARYISGQKKLRKPESWHLNQSLDKIGRLVVEQHKRTGGKEFNFPESLNIVYVRPLRVNITHILRTDASFFERWLSGLTYKLQNGEHPDDPEKVDDFLLLYSILTEAFEKRDKKEKVEAEKARIKTKREMKKRIKEGLYDPEKHDQKKLRGF